MNHRCAWTHVTAAATKTVSRDLTYGKTERETQSTAGSSDERKKKMNMWTSRRE
jgi:hypothetical protein